MDTRSLGVDWDGLERLVEQSDMPHRDTVLHILRHTPEWVLTNGVVTDSRKRQLGMLAGGSPGATWNGTSSRACVAPT